MPLPENPPGDTPINADAEKESNAIELLQAEVRFLRILFNSVSLVLIILTASLFAFMLHTKKIARRQVDESMRYIAEYKQKMEPRLVDLNSKLFAYAKLHTNFAPILLKYFGTTNPPSSGSVTSAISATPPPGLGTQVQPPP